MIPLAQTREYYILQARLARIGLSGTALLTALATLDADLIHQMSDSDLAAYAGGQVPRSPYPVPNTHRAEGKHLWVYGDSGAVIPGFKCTAGQEWMFLVQRALQTGAINSYAIGGSDAIGVAIHVLGTGMGGTGLPALAVGSKWDGTRRGICFVHTGVNDAAAYTDRTLTPGVPVALDANCQNGLTGAFRAILATLSSASRIEVETGTLTGTWSTQSSSSYSNGSVRRTSTVGDKVDLAGVVFPASGRVHLVLNAYDLSVATMANIQVKVDGTVVKTIAGSTLTMRAEKTNATPTSIVYAPAAVEIDAAAGSHTVTLTHAGNAGEFMELDCLLVPSPTPPPIFVPQEWMPISVAGGFTTGAITTLAANKAVLDLLYQQVCAEFPNVCYVPLGVNDTNGLGNDGLHPNDRGHRQEAESWIPAIENFLAGYDPDNMYNALANASAGASSLIASGTWGVASGSDYTAVADMVIYVSGGTVTAVAIDGTATGLTSGMFLIRAGHRIRATYSVAPNYAMFDFTVGV